MERGDEVRVRPAADADLDRIAEVWHQSATRVDGADPDMPTREALRRRIDDELRAGWDLHVALRGGRIVAMLALNPDDRLLDQLFVLPAEQRHGVGRALLDVAKTQMPQGFTLRAALSNRGARRLYEREGLELIGEGAHPRTGAPVCHYAWKAS